MLSGHGRRSSSSIRCERCGALRGDGGDARRPDNEPHKLVAAGGHAVDRSGGTRRRHPTAGRGPAGPRVGGDRRLDGARRAHGVRDGYPVRPMDAKYQHAVLQ